MARTTADIFKCPKCGSGRTKPVSMAIAAGTRRRTTVGVSRRSAWGSSSTYKTDLIASLPQRPSNGGPYLCMFLGICGLVFALVLAPAGAGSQGFAGAIAIVSILFLLGGWAAKKRPEELSAAQAGWDKRWICARCGHQWEGA